MVTLFHDLMHEEIEIYVDDMITKSLKKIKHVPNLCKLFKQLCKYQLKLNPTSAPLVHKKLDDFSFSP